jgi:hypothetical protein
MTTTVTVKANHGWPVLVTKIAKTGEKTDLIVEPNATQDFFVHESQDLLVHEIQPDEQAAADNNDGATDQSDQPATE